MMELFIYGLWLWELAYGKGLKNQLVIISVFLVESFCRFLGDMRR